MAAHPDRLSNPSTAQFADFNSVFPPGSRRAACAEYSPPTVPAFPPLASAGDCTFLSGGSLLAFFSWFFCFGPSYHQKNPIAGVCLPFLLFFPLVSALLCQDGGGKLFFGGRCFALFWPHRTSISIVKGNSTSSLRRQDPCRPRLCSLLTPTTSDQTARNGMCLFIPRAATFLPPPIFFGFRCCFLRHLCRFFFPPTKTFERRSLFF